MPKAIASMYTSSILSASSTVAGGGAPTTPCGVFVSRKRGTRMSTLAPRRSRMLAVRAGKRGCGLISASGTKSDCAVGPPGGCGGSVKVPTPRSGKHGTVGQISLGLSAASSRARRTFIFFSTRSRSAAKPAYGASGVASIIHEPYSGTQWHRS